MQVPNQTPMTPTETFICLGLVVVFFAAVFLFGRWTIYGGCDFTDSEDNN